MRYRATNLNEIYQAIREMGDSIALIDFIFGELGYELVVAQTLAREFYNVHKAEARVVALAWRGCPIILSNVSHDQIELMDIARSTRGNRRHKGAGDRYAWLQSVGHVDEISNLPNVIAHSPPLPAMDKQLQMRFGKIHTHLLEEMAELLVGEKHIFEPPDERLIREPYITVFDRNDKHYAVYNTQMWQIRSLHKIAAQYDIKLAVLSGYNPQKMPEDVLHFVWRYRDLDLLCNLVHNSLFFAGGAISATETAAAFGCNLLYLNPFPKRGIEGKHICRMAEGRGFRCLGILHGESKSDAISNMTNFLDSQLNN